MALGDLSGQTLTAGIYDFSGAVSIPASFTISGSPTDSTHDLTDSTTYMLTFFCVSLGLPGRKHPLAGRQHERLSLRWCSC